MSDLHHFQYLSLYPFLHFFLILLIYYHIWFTSIFISFRFLNYFSFICPFLKILSVVFIWFCVPSKFSLYFWKQKKSVSFLIHTYVLSPHHLISVFSKFWLFYPFMSYFLFNIMFWYRWILFYWILWAYHSDMLLFL